ncbi:hypothetical protein ACFFOM_09000 [Microlunatus capsulatus]|uniref:DUF7282 domain-containing protein n=1 Tax=Microlunatus capsulatus TaxID=99117 RepID=A0ABS4ZAP4_9ACTN|nr:hypothetical protein [Microlunatus capsulatus]MBP2418128.1 hypothetical protein [Microlunatus capsulatus]
MRTSRTTSALLAGTAAAALLLSACGDDAEPAAPAPEAPATSAAAPSAETTSAAPSADPTTASPSASASPSSAPSASGGPTVDDDRAELDVEDQSGDGRSVAVEEVRLTSGTGFVAVYTRDGQLLGSAEVGSGRGLTVDLDERIPATGEYRAVLFGDDGDGRFDADADPRVVEPDDDADEAADPVDDDFDYRVR